MRVIIYNAKLFSTVGTDYRKIAQVRHSFCSAVLRAITAEFQNGGYPLC